MPHEQAHDPVAVIKEPGMTASNVFNSSKIRNVMPLITQTHAGAQRANMRNMSQMQSPAHVNW